MAKFVLITVSIVSHGQGELVSQLLGDLRDHCASIPFHVLLTQNIEEQCAFVKGEYPFQINVIRNKHARGFAANHNEAFKIAEGDFFCVLNPDIRFQSDPFPLLVAGLLADPEIGVIAPLVTGIQGQIEESARFFPTPRSIIRKAIFGRGIPDYAVGHKPIKPEWVGGMFMLWHVHAFRQIGGFDDSFFLYYEDVDACARLRRSGFSIQLIPEARVIHIAQRSSHRKILYFVWHLKSMLLFFWKKFFLKLY